MYKYLLFVLLGLSLSNMAISQVNNQGKSNTIELIGKIKFYIHTVEKGQTLYYISKTYKVDIEDIIAENLGCDKGLTIGQKLRIPYNKGMEYYTHTIKSGESIWKLAKQYNSTEQEIIAENPSAKNGLSEGQILIIPTRGFDQIAKFNEKPTIKDTSKKEPATPTISTSKSIEKEKALPQNIDSVKKNPNTKPIITKEKLDNPRPKDSIPTKKESLKNEIKTKDTISKPENKISAPKGKDSILQKKDPIKSEIKTEESVLKTEVSKVEIKEIENKKLGNHQVKKGETLSGIASEYQTTVDELMVNNPSLKDGLKAGQNLKVPNLKKSDLSEKKKDKEEKKFATSMDDSIIYYKVKKNETLASIAKDHHIAVDDILFHNPEVVYGIETGQEIAIPIISSTKKANVTETSKQENASDFSKANNDSATNNTSINCEENGKSKRFKIAMMIPLYLSQVDEITIPDDNIPSEPVDYKSFSYVGFYEGATLAMDSLKAINFNSDISVYDITEDSSSIAKVLAKSEMKNMDLMIGPFFNNSLKTAASFAKTNQIPIVSPFAQESKILKENPYVFKITPSIPTQLNLVAKYIADTFSTANILVLHNLKAEELNQANEFYNTLKSEILKNNAKATIKLMDFAKNGGQAGVENYIDSTRKNVIFVISNKEVFVNKFLTSISSKTSNHDITIFGMPEWKNYTSVETEYFNKLNLHSFITWYVDYTRPEVQRFVSLYREKYKNEPDRYAFAGYDITMQFALALKKFGISFEQCINNVGFKPLQTQFNFTSNQKDGFENNFVNIYQIKDLKVLMVK